MWAAPLKLGLRSPVLRHSCGCVVLNTRFAPTLEPANVPDVTFPVTVRYGPVPLVEKLIEDVVPVFHLTDAVPVVLLPEQLPVPLPEALTVPEVTLPVPLQLLNL